MLDISQFVTSLCASVKEARHYLQTLFCTTVESGLFVCGLIGAHYIRGMIKMNFQTGIFCVTNKIKYSNVGNIEKGFW